MYGPASAVSPPANEPELHRGNHQEVGRILETSHYRFKALPGLAEPRIVESRKFDKIGHEDHAGRLGQPQVRVESRGLIEQLFDREVSRINDRARGRFGSGVLSRDQGRLDDGL